MNSHKHVAIFTRRSSALQSPGSCVAQAKQTAIDLRNRGLISPTWSSSAKGKAQLADRGHG